MHYDPALFGYTFASVVAFRRTGVSLCDLVAATGNSKSIGGVFVAFAAWLAALSDSFGTCCQCEQPLRRRFVITLQSNFGVVLR